MTVTFEVEAWMLYVLGAVLYILCGILTARRMYTSNFPDPEFGAFLAFLYWPVFVIGLLFYWLFYWPVVLVVRLWHWLLTYRNRND